MNSCYQFGLECFSVIILRITKAGGALIDNLLCLERSTRADEGALGLSQKCWSYSLDFDDLFGC